MKTSGLDFLLSAVCFTLLLAASLAAVAVLVVPLTVPLLGAYHVVADLLVFLLVYGLLSGLLLALLRRAAPLRPGSHPLDDRNFTLWKLYAMIFYTARAVLLPLTHMAARPLVLKLFGARIGADVAIGGDVDTPYLTTIGEGSAIGNGSHVVGTMTVNDRIVIGPVKIGRRVTIAMNAVVLPDVEIGDNAVVEIGSVVMPGTRIPPGERWRGNPARKWMTS
jgi:acetyltransferase-like isoleucine patch superfamily enzyme